MNKLFYAIILFFFSQFVFAQHSNTLAEEQIKLAMKFQEESWNRGDIEGFMQAYWKSDSLLFIGSKGPQYGWLNTLTNYKKSYPDAAAMGQLNFSNIKIEIISDSAAFVIGRWELKRKTDNLSGYYSLLWKKIDKVWKIVADHSS